MTQMKSHLLAPPKIIKIRFNYVNCIRDICHSKKEERFTTAVLESKSTRGRRKKCRDLWLMFALRKRRGGSRLFAVFAVIPVQYLHPRMFSM